MSLRMPLARASRTVPLQACRQQCARRAQRSTIARDRPYGTSPSLLRGGRSDPDPFLPSKRRQTQQEWLSERKRRMKWSGAGMMASMVVVFALAMQVRSPPAQADADPSDTAKTRGRTVLVAGPDGVVEHDDSVATGHSVVPTLARTVEFDDGKGGATEYQLVGVGIRTVSFLGISVYVGAMYIATEDVARLQELLVKKINPLATTLVAGEKEALKHLLLDPAEGERAWDELVRDAGVRTLFRIVPVRDTDFHHLRDGWVRGITARATKDKEHFGDEAFGVSLNNFKAIFNRGSVKKQRVMTFLRDSSGRLDVWFEDGKSLQNIGSVNDERISRAIWLNYLAGKTVSSEGLRKSVIDGVMEFVERPVGTVAAQVHV